MNWQYLLNWAQPLLLALLTGGIVLVRSDGQTQVASNSNEWQAVYVRTVKELVATEGRLRKCEAQLE